MELLSLVAVILVVICILCTTACFCAWILERQQVISSKAAERMYMAAVFVPVVFMIIFGVLLYFMTPVI